MTRSGNSVAPWKREHMLIRPADPAALTTSATKVYLAGDDSDNGVLISAPYRIAGIQVFADVNAAAGGSTCTVTLSKNAEASGTGTGALYSVALTTTSTGDKTGSDTTPATLTGDADGEVSSTFNGSSDDWILTAVNSTGTTLDVLNLHVIVEIEYLD